MSQNILHYCFDFSLEQTRKRTSEKKRERDNLSDNPKCVWHFHPLTQHIEYICTEAQRTRVRAKIFILLSDYSFALRRYIYIYIPIGSDNFRHTK